MPIYFATKIALWRPHFSGVLFFLFSFPTTRGLLWRPDKLWAKFGGLTRSHSGRGCLPRGCRFLELTGDVSSRVALEGKQPWHVVGQGSVTSSYFRHFCFKVASRGLTLSFRQAASGLIFSNPSKSKHSSSGYGPFQSVHHPL